MPTFRHSYYWRLQLGCFALLITSNLGRADEVQPDRLNFGQVHVGARVQGSVRIFVDPKDAREAKAKVASAAFVKIDKVDQGTQDFGPGNTKGYCDIFVTIDTATTGEFSAPMVMTLGDRRVEVPVAASILPRTPEHPRVLVADTPFQRFSTSDASLFDPWLKLVAKAGLDVDYLEVRGGKPVFEGVDLEKFDGILLGEVGLIGLQDADIAALRTYAERGGRIVVTANYFFRGTVDKANLILVPYGLRITDFEAPTQDPIEVEPPLITPCPITQGVKKLSFHRPSPAVRIDKDQTMVIVASPTNPDEHLVAMALAGEGQVVSLGVSLWWLWLNKTDNALLLQNLLPKRPRAK